MKFIISILLTALLSFVGGLWLQWWEIAVAAFLVSLIIPQQRWDSFLSGSLGVFFLWGILSWWIDFKNNSILSQKIAQILPLGGSPYLLILFTAFVGGIVSGVAALTASYLRKT
ncbi:MAG TPA: hypothetical protein VK787_12015 [Puia sp.]|jgi:hypothetical protein|nr:hypothetical protein [Puia sp.]